MTMNLTVLKQKNLIETGNLPILKGNKSIKQKTSSDVDISAYQKAAKKAPAKARNQKRN